MLANKRLKSNIFSNQLKPVRQECLGKCSFINGTYNTLFFCVLETHA